MIRQLRSTARRRLRFGVLPGLLLCASAAAAQNSATADQAFATNNWAVAAREYLALLKRDSSDMRVQFRYGVSLFELKDYRAALPAFERAANAGFQVNMAEFRLARAFAQLGELEKGLEHLERAAAVGVPYELITSHADIAPLRGQPRYTALISRLENAKFPCRNNPAAHQLDFWIGDWTVTVWDTGGAAARTAGSSKVSSMLENCLVFEEWTSANGPNGKSFNFYNSTLSAWRQVWVSEDGANLDYMGKYESNAMRFTGWRTDSAGNRSALLKLTLTQVARDTVRQLFEESTDNGRTWRSTFDGRYVRKP